MKDGWINAARRSQEGGQELLAVPPGFGPSSFFHTLFPADGGIWS